MASERPAEPDLRQVLETGEGSRPPFGLYSRSLSLDDRVDAALLLDRVAALGLGGCMFSSPSALSARLDPAELESVRAHADVLGLYLELALGQINPYRFDARPDLVALGEGDARFGLERMLRAAQTIGCTELMFSIGTLADRSGDAPLWAEQLRATSQFLRELAPILRDLGCHLNLKTHEEITSFEVVRLIEATGPDVLGVCFDPVNVLARLEHPLAAAQRLAPYVRQIQLDDARIRLSKDGLVRRLCACGSGIINWPAILRAVLRPELPARLTVELHRAQLSMPIFDSNWLAMQPDLTISEFAAVIELTQAPAGVANAWEARGAEPIERLAPTIAYLRGLLPAYAAVSAGGKPTTERWSIGL
jgi:sugar phosphate isomerase/epimerase